MNEVGARAASCSRRHKSSLYLTDMSRESTMIQAFQEAEEEFLRALKEQNAPVANGDDLSDEEDINDGIFKVTKSLTMSKAETFSFRPKLIREETLLEDPPRKYWEPQEIKIRLYLRECERLKVIPVSAYLKQPTKNFLKIKHYNMGPNGAKALSAALLLDTTISYLDIEGNSITSLGLASIKEALSENMHISYLNIADNRLGSRGAELIGAMLAHNHVLEIFDVSKNGFRDSDAHIFAKIISENRTLKELILAGNEFEDRAGTEFGAALASNDILERLDVSWNHIRKKGAADFAQGVKENVGLKKLNVSFNGFGTEGTAFMGVALATNRTLLELDMSKNRITEFDLKLFTKQMAQNDTLQILRIGENLFNALPAMEILRVVLALETSSIQVLDFGTMCVDQCFLLVLKELQEVKDVKVIHGRIQNVYLDRDMMPVPENPDQALTEYSGTTPGFSEIDKSEKGKTYVVEELENNTDNENSEREINRKVENEERTDDSVETKDVTGETEDAKGDEEGIDFDEKKLDDEVEAVTGKPEPEKKAQKPLADDRGSAGTMTPDI